jgi:cytochrome c oxidase subunit 2
MGNIPLFPQQASNFASHVDGLYFFILGVTGFFALLVVTLVTIFAIRYRRRDAAAVGHVVHGALVLEITWTVIPLVLAMVMFYWGAVVYFDMAKPPQNAMEVYTVGKRWMWKFQHVTGQREINELHIPVNTPIKLLIGSEDVIHSVYVPAFRVKMDAVPGKTTSLWFTATKPGRYHLFCTEYCGQRHSGMTGWVEVMEPAAFQTWLAGGPPPTNMADAGQKLFADLACVTCHRLDDQGRGPALHGIFGKEVRLAGGGTIVADEAYVRESIVNPQAKLVAGFQPLMPTFQGLVTEEQLNLLIAYIKSLETRPPGAGTGRPADTSGGGAPPSPSAPPQ